MAKTRRSREEIQKLVAEVNKLREGGMATEAAQLQVGISDSVYRRNMKKKGSVRADSLPARPPKGGKRPPKKVDMEDIASVANRIARLDKKLHDIDGLVNERIFLVGVLVKLLKADQKKKRG